MVSESVRSNYQGVFDGRIGFGRAPALIAVDFLQAYTLPESPLYAPAVGEAARVGGRLARAARHVGVPVFHTRVEYSEGGLEGGIFVRKVPALRALVAGSPLVAFIDDAAPAPGDVVLLKHYASAFFGTSLASALTAAGVDTLLLAGCSTSGCVRATAVDGMQCGFRVIVVREAVADRRPEPHEASLFDLDSKYADVVGAADVERYLQAVHAPQGAAQRS